MLARSNISIVRACLAEPSLMGGRTRCTNSSPYITYIHTHYLAHIHDHFSHCHQLHSNLYRDASCVQPLEREFSNFRALSSNLDRQGTFGLCLPTSLLASLQNYNKESIWPKCFYNISPVDRCTTDRNSGDKLPADPKCVPLYYWTLLVLAANVSICHQVGAELVPPSPINQRTRPPLSLPTLNKFGYLSFSFELFKSRFCQNQIANLTFLSGHLHLGVLQ